MAAVLIGVGACATMKPPAVNSGPVLSKDGVGVALLRQSCSQTEPVDEVPVGSLDEAVEIEVRNGSPQPLTVHPDRFRLVAPGDGAPVTATSRSAEPLTVATGDTKTLQLQFTAQGRGLECSKEMQLDATAAITLGDSPVALQPVPFRPL